MRSLMRGATGIFTTATTVLNPRVSRSLVLQVSLLLFGRALLECIPLPLGSLFGDTFTPFILNAFQTSIGFAAISAYMDDSSWISTIGRKFFAPADSVFLSLYASLVFVFGPALSLAESAVAVFYMMKISRQLEQRMDSIAANESNPWKYCILGSAALLYGLIVFTAAFCYKLSGAERFIPVLILACSVIYFVIAYNNDNSNILEAALLSTYASFLILVGVLEEFDSKNSSSVTPIFASVYEPPNPQQRAIILVVTSLSALLTLPRVPELINIVMFSAETVEASQRSAQLPGAPNVPPLDLSAAASPGGPKVMKGISLAVAVIVVTFRILVWSGTLKAGEYYPIYARCAQLLLQLAVYAVFLKMEADDDEDKQNVRMHAAAGAPNQHSKMH